MFGIPGDSITAIAIGVLYLKDMNPGPTLFVNNPQNIYAVFIVFILAQLLMLPLRLDARSRWPSRSCASRRRC